MLEEQSRVLKGYNVHRENFVLIIGCICGPIFHKMHGSYSLATNPPATLTLRLCFGAGNLGILV